MIGLANVNYVTLQLSDTGVGGERSEEYYITANLLMDGKQGLVLTQHHV